MLHQHTTDADLIASNVVWLEHAAHFHAHGFGDRATGWHWHLLYPSPFSGDESESDQANLDNADLARQHEWQSGNALANWLVPSVVSGIESIASDDLLRTDSHRGAKSFLSTFQSRPSLRAQLGVIVC